jgi:hypothetical protein
VLKGSNKEVVLKVLKPGVSDILTADLSFLYVASRVLEFLNPELKRTSLSAIVGDIRASMMEEVDFLKEQRNIGQFQVRASLFMVAHFTHAKKDRGTDCFGKLATPLTLRLLAACEWWVRCWDESCSCFVARLVSPAFCLHSNWFG